MDFFKKIVFPRPSKHKVMLVILDGLADIPIEGLGNKTPLEVAKTPNMDRLATRGQTGLMYPFIPWVPLGSGPAHLALLGYDPLKNYVGRGPLEALGFNIPTEDDDVIVRLNFATVDPTTRVVIDRRAGRIETRASEQLFNYLNENLDRTPPEFTGISWKVHATRGYRGVIIIKGASSWIDGSDPRDFSAVRTITPQKDDELSRRTAKFMNWFLNASHELLQTHPINIEHEHAGLPAANHLLSRGAGNINYPEPFRDRYKFSSPVFISGYPLYAGLARFLGIETVSPDGGEDAKIIDKFKKACDVYPEHDITILHVKDPDVAGEDGNPVSKIKVIEEIDKGVGLLVDCLTEHDTIVITADHATPAKIMDHSGHPVPIVACGPYTANDDVRAFSERDCAKGSLGIFQSNYCMNLLLMITLRLKTFGA